MHAKDKKLDDGSKYRKTFTKIIDGEKVSIQLDIYDILDGFEVCNPATQHAIKKLLAGGNRGFKDKITDLEEAKWSIGRAIELEKEL